MANAEDVHDVVVMIGTCVLGAWVADFIREAYTLSVRPIEVHLGDGDHIFPDIGRTSGEPRVMMMIGPGRKLNEVIAAGGTPIVAVLDDPVDSVRYAMAAKQMTFLAAMRDQTKNASAHHLFHDNPAVLLVERRSGTSARAVLSAIMAHCGLQVRDGEEDGLLERFGGPAAQGGSLEAALAAMPHYARLDGLKEVITAEQMTVVRQVLSPMVVGALGQEVGPIVWAAKVFLHGDKVDEAAPAVVDVTGAARVIFFGPYFHLPPGLWSARILLAFSPEARGTPFRLVLYAHERPIAKAMITPDDGGAFEGAFSFRHTEPEHRLELHFMNDEGTIEGQVSLGQITFTRVQAP